MARPRDPSVPTERGSCPVHGAVELRVYSNGTTPAGRPKTKRVCPACHAEAELARHHARKDGA